MHGVHVLGHGFHAYDFVTEFGCQKETILSTENTQPSTEVTRG